MTDTSPLGVRIRAEIGERLRDVEKEFPNRTAAAEAAGVSKSTFQRWVDAQTDITIDALIKLAAATDYSAEWLAFGRGPKLRSVDDSDVAAAVAGGWIDGDLLEEILSKIRRFMLSRRQPLPLDRYHRLGGDLYSQVARFPTAAERNAALQVLVEREVPAAYAALSGHDRTAAARFWTPAEPPPDAR